MEEAESGMPTRMLGIAVVTQVMVLSGVAIVMGVAVVAMCALFIELLVLTVVATALERGVFSFEDLGTASEIAATVLFAVITVLLAAFSQSSDGLLDDSSIAALKLT